jgi:hypothetical protein
MNWQEERLRLAEEIRRQIGHLGFTVDDKYDPNCLWVERDDDAFIWLGRGTPTSTPTCEWTDANGYYHGSAPPFMWLLCLKKALRLASSDDDFMILFLLKALDSLPVPRFHRSSRSWQLAPPASSHTTHSDRSCGDGATSTSHCLAGQ